VMLIRECQCCSIINSPITQQGEKLDLDNGFLPLNARETKIYQSVGSHKLSEAVIDAIKEKLDGSRVEFSELPALLAEIRPFFDKFTREQEIRREGYTRRR